MKTPSKVDLRQWNPHYGFITRIIKSMINGFYVIFCVIDLTPVLLFLFILFIVFYWFIETVHQLAF